MDITRKLAAAAVAGALLLPIPAFAQECPDDPAEGSGVCVLPTGSESETEPATGTETETETTQVKDLASEDNGAPASDTLSATGVEAGVIGLTAVAAIGLGSGAVVMARRRRTDA